MLTLEEVTQLLWQASEKKRACRIQMKGEFLSRTIHPYGVCKTSRNQIALICWQTLGFTKAGGKEGFRNLILEDCEDVEILENRFQVRKDFNAGDSQYKEWVFHI
jgi:hypothetical protein